MAKILEVDNRLDNVFLEVDGDAYDIGDLYANNNNNLDQTAGALTSLITNNEGKALIKAEFYERVGQDLRDVHDVTLEPSLPTGMTTHAAVYVSKPANGGKEKLLLRGWRCVRGSGKRYTLVLHPNQKGTTAHVLEVY